MLGGDYGTARTSTTDTDAVEQAPSRRVLKSVGQQSNVSAPSGIGHRSLRTIDADLRTAVNAERLPIHGSGASRITRAMPTAHPEPAFLLEEPYDEEGPDGNSVNPSATQPVRRFQWWGWLSGDRRLYLGQRLCLAVQRRVWQSHLNTQGAQDMARLNAFVRSIDWWRLVPDRARQHGDARDRRQGTIDATNYVTAAATPWATCSWPTSAPDTAAASPLT